MNYVSKRFEKILFCLDGNEFYIKEFLERIFFINIKSLKSTIFSEGEYGFGIQCYLKIKEADSWFVFNLHNRLKVNQVNEDFEIIENTNNFFNVNKTYDVFFYDKSPYFLPACCLEKVNEKCCRVFIDINVEPPEMFEKLRALFAYLKNGVASDSYTKWINALVCGCNVKNIDMFFN